MGGFIYVRKDSTNNAGASFEHPAKKAMANRGLVFSKTIDSDQFKVHIYNKSIYATENYIEYENGDFVLATGTFFYCGMNGQEGLELIYNDFSEEKDFFNSFLGNYGICIYKKGRLVIFNDYGGIYHLYRTLDDSIISTSFLAVVKSLPKTTVSKQELYEYIWDGTMYGGRTFVHEVERLDSNKVYQLHPKTEFYAKDVSIENVSSKMVFNEQVKAVADSILSYFELLGKHFGNNISTALSGGFDSRLILAAMRKKGLVPYVYVYGNDSSPDVQIAKMICQGEGIDLDHINRSKLHTVGMDDFKEFMHTSYYFNDGQGMKGCFEGGQDLSTRRDRALKANLQLNGGGGEAMRNYFTMPDKTYPVEVFVKTVFFYVHSSMCTDQFNENEYYGELEDKIKKVLGISSNLLTRSDVELVYPKCRLRYWMGQNNSINNNLACALTPLAEPRYTWPSCAYPLEWKNGGRFEAAVINIIDPDLARYPSQYGHNFADPIPLKKRAVNTFLLNMPDTLRSHIRRWRNRTQSLAMPFYLTEEYLKQIIDFKNLQISEYMQLNKIDNPDVFNRAMTVELTISNWL